MKLGSKKILEDLRTNKRHKEENTKPKLVGRKYIRTITVKGHKYQQLCRYERDENGKRKLVVLEHLGRKD